MKSSTNRGGHNANPLFSAFLKALLSVMLLLVGNVAVKAQTDVKFDENVRYSQWVLDSRLGDFYGNTNIMGFATYNRDLTVKSSFPTWKKGDLSGNKTIALDYVAGLVAKATLEAAILYKDYDWSMPWFKSVESYANHVGVSVPTGGGSLDDLNGAKMYFGLKTLAEGKFKSIAESTTASNAATQLGKALTGLGAHNTGCSFDTGTTVNSVDVGGGWFHKKAYNNQMWLDGQYMGPALLAQLINDYSEYSSIARSVDADWDLIAKQFTIVWNMCWDESAELLYHAFSSEKNNTWAGDAEIWTTRGTDTSNWTGLSSGGHSAAFWGRAEGWYFLALVDVLEQMPETNANYATLKGYLDKLAAGIKKRQNTTNGCWYQLIGKAAGYSAQYYNGKSYTAKSNYPESSCTAIFTAAYLKAMRLGLLDRATYEETAKSGYKGLVETFLKQKDDGTVVLYGCSRSAGLGTTAVGNEKFRDGSNAYYLLGYDVTPTPEKTEEPNTVVKEPAYTEGKVLGAFILAATEYERQYTNVTNKLVKIGTDLPSTAEENTPLKVVVADAENSNVAYQWYKGTYNNSTAITEATSAEYTPAESGTYYCKITVTSNVTRSTDSYSLMSSETVVGASSTDDNTGDNTTTTKYEIWFAGTGDANTNNKTQSTFFGNLATGTKNKGSNTIKIGGVDYTVTNAVETSTSITFTIDEGQTGNLSMFVSSTGSGSRTITLTKTGDTAGTSTAVSGTTLKRVDFSGLTSGTYTLSFGNKNVHIGLLAMELVGGSTQNPDPAPTDKYTVTYEMNDIGTNPAPDGINNVTGLTADMLKEPVATGYTFGGWFTDAEFKTPAEVGTISGSTTLYAKWTKNKYTVTPSATNGTISINNREVTSATSYDYGTKLVFKATPANGYEFVSWTVDGTQGTEAADHTYTIASLDKDTKVTATFKKKTASTDGEAVVWTFTNSNMSGTFGAGKTVTFTSEDGKNTISYLSGSSDGVTSSSTTIDNKEYSSYLKISGKTSTEGYRVLTFKAPSAKGKIKMVFADNATKSPTFTDITANKVLGSIIAKSSTSVTSDELSTAVGNEIQIKFPDAKCYIYSIVWIPIEEGPTYTIKYDLKGVTPTNTVPENKTVAGGKIVLPEPAPTAEGYTFGGWYKDEACTEENKVSGGEDISESETTSGVMTLYAKWTRNTYTVTTSCVKTNGTITVSATDGSGNAIIDLDLTKVEHGTKLVFTAKAEEGYVFSSWTVNGTQGTANDNVYTIEALKADTEVKANFKSTSAPTDGEICHFTGKTPSQSWTTVSGKYQTLKTGVTYKNVTYNDVVKMETSTAITVKTSETQKAIFVFDAANKRVKIDGVVYTTNNDGYVIIEELTAGTHTLTKGDVVNLVAIELVSNIAPEQDSRATFTYNNAELKFSEIKDGENTVHVAEIVLVNPPGVSCEVLFKTAEGATLTEQNKTEKLTSPITITAPAVGGEASYYYTVTSSDEFSTTTYKIVVKVISEKRKIVLKYNQDPAKFVWDVAKQGKVNSKEFNEAWANKPVLKAYLANADGTASTTEITPLPLGITYTPDIAGIVNIDAFGNINVIPGADGGVSVYAQLSNSAEYENSNEVQFDITIIQGFGTTKLTDGQKAPSVNKVEYITGKGEDLVKITFGGWKYKHKDGTPNKYEYETVSIVDNKETKKTVSKTDKWNNAETDKDIASIDEYKYGYPGENDAMDEAMKVSTKDIYGSKRYGWFQYPDVDKDGKVQTYPFTLPVRGSYMTFEPLKNGTLTVYIVQNGAWNTTKVGDKITINKGEFRPHSFYVVNQRGLTLDKFATSWSVNTKQTVTKDYSCDRDNLSDEGINSKNVADWPEFKNNLTEQEQIDIEAAWTGGIHGAQKIVKMHDGSFLAIQKGVVKYTFHVTGHETYYFFSNFSKMGFCGAKFIPDEEYDDNGKPMQPVAELELSDTKPFPAVTREPVEGEFYDENEQMPKYTFKYDGSETINGNPINVEGGVQAPQFKTITMNRTFKKGQWTTLCLPFNMTQGKVEEIFGVGTQLLLLKNATITNGTVKLHFLYHEIQNVLPGYPYLIKPTFKEADGTDYPRGAIADRTIDEEGNLTRFVVQTKHINPDTPQQEIDCGDYVAKCVDEHYSTGELTNLANSQTGYSVNYKNGDIFISEGDGNLYISNGNAYGKGYRSYIEKKEGTPSVKSISMVFSGVDDGEHNTPTEIKFAELAPEAVKALGFSGVYNLNGQYVGDTTENLPAGVYIANGRKVVIK